MSQAPAFANSRNSPLRKERSDYNEYESLSSFSERLEQLKYEWEQYWNEKRQSHRNRNQDSECECECGSDEDDVFELEDLKKRLRRLKNQFKNYLARIGKSLDDDTSVTEDDYQYVGIDIIMNEETESNSRLQEIRLLQRRINTLRQTTHNRKHMRASNKREERMHEARVMLHRMRAALCANEQEWQKILDDLEDDMEADEQHLISKQNHRTLSPVVNQVPANVGDTIWLGTKPRQRVPSTDGMKVFDSAVECQEYLTSLSEPVQLVVSGGYARDKRLITTFYNILQVDSIRQIVDDDEIQQEGSAKSVLVLDRRRIVIVFLTSSTEDAEILVLSKQLNQTVDYIIIFDNAVDCFDYLATTTDRVISVVVVDDYANNQNILTMLNESPPVSIVYRRIGGQDQRPLIDERELMDICPKLQGSFNEINPLRRRINADLPIAQDTFNVFSQNDKQCSVRDLKAEDVIFVWYQIMINIIQSFPVTAETRIDFLAECRKHCDVSNDFRRQQINDFEMKYRSTEAFRWYTKASCFFEITNEALRKQNVTTIYNLRLFIKDLSSQLMEKREANPDQITLYRGQRISNEEIAKIQGKHGSLIAFNTFLSTSHDKTVAGFYGGDGIQLDSDTHSFLIMEFAATMDICCNLINYSSFSDEEEYLFPIGAIFKIVSFELKSPRSYHAKFHHIENIDCVGLNAVKKNFEQRILLDQGPINLVWGRFLYHIGEYDAAKEHYMKLLDELTDNQSESAITMNNDLAQIYFHQGLYMEARDFQKTALDSALLVSISLNMSILYENQGNILLKLNEHAHALDDYRRALDIEQRRKSPKEKNIARIYSNMGMAHNNLRQFTLALNCFRRAFKIQRRITLADSTDLAATCNNIGIVYTNIGEHKRAHKYYSDAFSIALRSLPYDHPSVQMYLKNRDAYLTATAMHDNRKSVLVEMSCSRRRDSDISTTQIEIILDSSTT